jgi:hypothetical protein
VARLHELLDEEVPEKPIASSDQRSHAGQCRWRGSAFRVQNASRPLLFFRERC